MMKHNPICPDCGCALWRVCNPNNSYLSDEQFDSVRAGDWFCQNHDELYRYFWNKNLSTTYLIEENKLLTKLHH